MLETCSEPYFEYFCLQEKETLPRMLTNRVYFCFLNIWKVTWLYEFSLLPEGEINQSHTPRLIITRTIRRKCLISGGLALCPDGEIGVAEKRRKESCSMFKNWVCK